MALGASAGIGDASRHRARPRADRDRARHRPRAVAAVVTRTLGTLLYGVGAADPATFLGVIGLLAVVSLAACSVPALRAARVDPMQVLRQD